jgi:flagellar basal body rod protein FlgG
MQNYDPKSIEPKWPGFTLLRRVNGKVRYGKLNVVVFNNPQGLESINKSYYTATKESGSPQEIKPDISSATQVKQGFVEGSNVDTAKTFMELAQMKNILGAQFKVLKSIDKIYENIHYTISRSS